VGSARDDVLSALVNYYRTARLGFQKAFFEKRAKSHEQLDKITRHIPLVLFFLSLISVLAHFAIDMTWGSDKPRLHELSTPLVVLAACLPVLGSGIRTLRLAYEFARNTSRYRAKTVALDRLDRILGDESDPWSKLRELWYAEELFAFEHREWCRLMIEAEWLP
jgi:hypothetical protein